MKTATVKKPGPAARDDDGWPMMAFKLPAETKKEFKARCALHGVMARDKLVQLVEEWLRTKEGKQNP